jgi:excinuclease UvrABC nuclease subunit
VVLDPSYTGMIVRITELQNFWVIILVKIFEWKMTDVIREKKSKEERSINQMKASLETDFWAMNDISSWDTVTFISSSMKKIKSSDRKQINDLMTKFLDSYIASTTFDIEDNLTQDLLWELQKRYFLTTFPYQIECIDISHLSGSYVSGGLSCMREWLPYKPGYRHYKIKLLEDNKSNYSNDFLSLQEIIVRRFWLKNKNNSTIEFPNLFILDGWKWQLNTVLELCQIFPALRDIIKITTFISLGKGKARKESAKSKGETEMIYYFDHHLEIQSIPLIYDTADMLLTKIRDEAHRFANKYRTTRMSKEWK